MRPLLLLFLAPLGACVEYDLTFNTKGSGGLEDTSPSGGEDGPSVTDSELGAEPIIGDCACPDGFSATPDGDSCTRRVSVPATWNGAALEVCRGAVDAVYGKFGALYPDGTNVQDNYWGDLDEEADGRLNEVGVWSCGGASVNYEPNFQWIGFATCVELPAAGDYLLGIAGDNNVRMRVDGVELYSDTRGDTLPFNYWNLRAVSLSSGRHHVELEGLNQGSIASFGAELAGPFKAGSLTDDATMIAADYDGRRVFSSLDREGGTFELGVTTGWSCPDGAALNVCDEEPECTTTERVECQ